MSLLKWLKNRGRNGWDAILDVALDACVEARNVHLYNGGLGTRRGGSVSITITGVTAPIHGLFEYIPGQDQTAAELFVVDSAATVKIFRCAAGSSFTSLTLKDNVLEGLAFSCATLNKKLYMAYDSTVNRLHVFDPGYSTTEVRRAGVAPFAAAATVANTGSGSYAATARYYKTRSVEQQSSLVIRRSEANAASTIFTPSGSGTAARITRPTAVNEGETHWEVYGSLDAVTYYGPIGTIAIATTTYDDSSTPSTWAATYSAEPSAGTYTPFPSVKCLGTTGTRLYGLGVWETAAGDSLTPKNGRFYFGPVLDSTATHDDERINNTTTLQGYIDLARNAGAVDRGVTPQPVNNIVYAFQSKGVYGLMPTESDSAPFRRVVMSSDVGNLHQRAIVMATDRNGRPCCYFLDPVRGPYVVGGSDGLKWCGKDVADLWATVNKDTATIPGWGLWYPDRQQVMFFVCTGANTDQTLALVLDVTEQHEDEDGDLRGGWTSYDNSFVSAARCGVMFSNTLAATRSLSRVPYTSGASKLLRYDESVHRDDGTDFQAYVKSGAQAVDTVSLEIQKAYVIASAQAGVTIRQTLIRNTGDETSRTSDALLTPVGSETTVLKKFEDAALQDAWCFQVQIGDSTGQNVAWQIFQWRAKVKSGAEF